MPTVWHTTKLTDEVATELDKFIRRNKKKGVSNRTDAINILLEKSLTSEDVDSFAELQQRFDGLVDMIKELPKVKTAEQGRKWSDKVKEIIGE